MRGCWMLAAVVVAAGLQAAAAAGSQVAAAGQGAAVAVSTAVADLARLEARARHGDPVAQHDLGVAQFHGLGAPVDRAAANAWFRRAAEQGFPPAQHQLGLSHAKGAGVPRDLVQAYLWLGLAALGGVEAAAADWRVAAGLMTPAETVEGRRLVRAWRPAEAAPRP